MVDPQDNVTQQLPGVDMAAIPPQPGVTTEELSQWFTVQDQLKKLKVSEMLMRKRIFGFFFPSPKEGTNTVPLPDSYVLKGGYPITREVDVGAFTAVKEEMTKLGVNADMLVEWKPSLKVAVYRELTDEQQKMFDRCLIIKPGSPSLAIELPAKAKKAVVGAPPAAITVTGQGDVQ